MTHRLDDVVEVPNWYEIISVMSFALSGIINTLVNIVFLQLIFLVGFDPENITKKTFISFIITAIILNVLVAIGVYLGRQIRFNSWDVLHPKSFLKKLKNHFNSSRVLFEFILFVAMHATFFMILYYALGIQRIFI